MLSIAENNGAILIVDQSYRGTQDEGHTFDASELIDGGNERSMIVINSVTKAFGLRGLRSGWAVGSLDLIKTLKESQIGRSSEVYKKLLLYILKNIETSDKEKQDTSLLSDARKTLVDTVNELKNISVIEPKGGVTALIKLPTMGEALVEKIRSEYELGIDLEDDEVFVEYIKIKYDLVIDFGSKFGAPGTVRISYANFGHGVSKEDFIQALKIIDFECGTF